MSTETKQPDAVGVIVVDGNKRLVDITPMNHAAGVECLTEWLSTGQVDGACLRNFHSADLSFIAKFPQITALSIANCTAVKLPSFEHLPGLTTLGLGGGKQIADLSPLTQLTLVYGLWGKGVIGLSQLDQLTFVKFNGCRADSLESLGLPQNVEDLRLVRGNLGSIEGIGRLKKLTHVWLCALNRLTSLSDIDAATNLQRAEFECLKQVQDFHILGRCKNLKHLNLLENGSLPSMDWIRGNQSLESLGLFTNVLDGDLTPVLDLPHLVSFGADNKKHYRPSAKELERRFEGAVSQLDQT